MYSTEEEGEGRRLGGGGGDSGRPGQVGAAQLRHLLPLLHQPARGGEDGELF